jgi:hypothetical protein
MALTVAISALMPFPVINLLLTGCQLSPLSVERSTATGTITASEMYQFALLASERNVSIRYSSG